TPPSQQCKCSSPSISDRVYIDDCPIHNPKVMQPESPPLSGGETRTGENPIVSEGQEAQQHGTVSPPSQPPRNSWDDTEPESPPLSGVEKCNPDTVWSGICNLGTKGCNLSHDAKAAHLFSDIVTFCRDHGLTATDANKMYDTLSGDVDSSETSE